MEKDDKKEKEYFCVYEKEYDLHKTCKDAGKFNVKIIYCNYKTECQKKYGLIKPCRLFNILEACKNKETIFMVENERTEEFLCDYGYAAIHCDDFCDYKSLEKLLKNQNLFFVFPEDRTSEGKPMLKEYENMLHYFAKIADSVKFGIFENYDSSIRTPRETKKFLKKFEDEIKKGVNVTEDFSLF